MAKGHNSLAKHYLKLIYVNSLYIDSIGSSNRNNPIPSFPNSFRLTIFSNYESHQYWEVKMQTSVESKSNSVDRVRVD